MQGARSTSSRLVPEPEPTRAGLSPTIAFLLLVALIAIVGLVIFLLRPDPVPTPDTSNTKTEQSFALTNEEAITRFEELQLLHRRVYATHDSSLIGAVFTSDAVTLDTVRREVRVLARDQVRARVFYDTRSLSVEMNDSDEIRIRQVARVRSKFIDQTGKDITRSGAVEVQEIVWTLRRENSEWLIYDSLIVDARPAGD